VAILCRVRDVRTALAWLLAAAVLGACAGPRQRELGSYEPPAGSCLDNEAGRQYFASVWRALQDAWEIPEGIPDDQRVEFILAYDGRGDPLEALVVEETDAALRASVDEALAAAELPETPDELRECLAKHRMTGTFRNTNRR
jgi:hypothetical protein